MEFNSQICTNIEQSERLLAMGLRPETADMSISTRSVDTDNGIHYSLIPYSECKYRIMYNVIPAWSLHRLIEIYSKDSITPRIKLDEINFEWLVDAIAFRIQECDIYKEYLKEK